MSSAARCSVRTTAVVPSYSSTRSLTMRPRRRKSSVIGVPGYGVGCWMYGQSTYRFANARLASIDARVSSGLPTMMPPTTREAGAVERVDRLDRRVADLPSAFALRVLRRRAQEREVFVEDVLDAEEDVAKARLPHQRRQRARRGSRSTRSSPARCSGCRSGPASTIAWHKRLEPRDVERDVVVDQEDRARAAAPRVGDVRQDAREVEGVEVAPAHLDDRAEAAVVGAAARGLDDVDRPAEEGVAGQDARGAVGQLRDRRRRAG